MREKYRKFSESVRSKIHEINHNDINTNNNENENSTVEEKKETEVTNRISKIIGNSKIPIIYDPNNYLKNTFTSDYRKDFATKNIRKKAKEAITPKMTEKKEKNFMKDEVKEKGKGKNFTDLISNSTISAISHTGISKKKKKKKILKCDQDFLYDSIDEFSYENLYKRYTRGKVRPTQQHTDPTQNNTDPRLAHRNIGTKDCERTQDDISILQSTLPNIDGPHTESKQPYHENKLNYESLHDTTYDSKYFLQHDSNSSLQHHVQAVDEREESYLLSENTVHDRSKILPGTATERNIVTLRYGKKTVRTSSTYNSDDV